MPAVDAVHRLLAYIAIPLIAGGIGWSFFVTVGGGTAGPAFDRFQAALVSLLVVAVASGLIMLATGARPDDGLHLLYAAVALAVVPLARSFAGGASGRATAALMLAAFLALGAVLYRLFTTG